MMSQIMQGLVNHRERALAFSPNKVGAMDGSEQRIDILSLKCSEAPVAAVGRTDSVGLVGELSPFLPSTRWNFLEPKC